MSNEVFAFIDELRAKGLADGVDPVNTVNARDYIKVYRGGKLAGVAIVTLDNELVSVAVSPKYRGQGIGHEIVEKAKEAGATHLTCFDFQGLPSLYASHGFAEVERSPWNDAYAPENWSYSRHGRPDYLVMKLNESTRG